MFWELLKCMIRCKTISYSSYLKKKNQSLEIEYEKKLHTLQLSYESNPRTVSTIHFLTSETYSLS
jgi:hypothetical protein